MLWYLHLWQGLQMDQKNGWLRSNEAEKRRKEEERLRAIEEAERLKLWEEEQKRLEIEKFKKEQEEKRIYESLHSEYQHVLQNDVKYKSFEIGWKIVLVILVLLFISALISRNDDPWYYLGFWIFIIMPFCFYKKRTREKQIWKALMDKYK